MTKGRKPRLPSSFTWNLVVILFILFFSFNVGQNIVTVSDPQNGDVSQYDMASNTIYNVVACGVETTIILDGTGDGGPPPQNWVVWINLPSFDKPAYVNILGVAGTNGIVQVNVPGTGVYDVRIHRAQEPIDFGTVFGGNVRIQITQPAHLMVSSQTVMNVEVDGTPADCDLVIDSPPGSRVNLLRMRNNLILVNSTNLIPANIVMGNISISSIGIGSSNNIDCSLFGDVSYSMGCVSNNYQYQVPASAWFLTQLAQFGLPTDALGCLLYTLGTSSIEITATSVYLSELDGKVYDVTVPTCILDDPTPWQNIHIEGTNLNVDNRYQIHMQDQTIAHIPTPVFLSKSRTIFTIACADPWASEISTTWLLGNESWPSYVAWNASTCNAVFFATNEEDMAQVYFRDRGDISLAIEFPDLNTHHVHRKINVEEHGIRQVSSRNVSLFVNWNPDISSNLQVIINDGDNDIELNATKVSPLPYFIIHHATATLHSPVTYSLEFPDQALQFNSKYRTVTPVSSRDGNSDCLLPNVQCIAQRWLDVDVFGAFPCRTSEDINQCHSIEAIKINTDLPIVCNPPRNQTVGWTLRIELEDTEVIDTPYSKMLLRFLYYFFPITIGIGIFGWVIWGNFIDGGWTVFVFTAFLTKVNTKETTWNLTALSLVRAAKEAVGNLERKVCTDNDITTNQVEGIFLWIMVGIGFCGVLMWMGQLICPVDRLKRRAVFEGLRRFLCGIGIFIILPSFISHVSHLSFLSILSCLLPLMFLWDSAYSPPDYWLCCLPRSNQNKVKRGREMEDRESLLSRASSLSSGAVARQKRKSWIQASLQTIIGQVPDHQSIFNLFSVIISLGIITVVCVLGRGDVVVARVDSFFYMVLLLCLLGLHMILEALKSWRQHNNRASMIVSWVFRFISASFGGLFIGWLFWFPEAPTIFFICYWCLWVGFAFLSIVPQIFLRWGQIICAFRRPNRHRSTIASLFQREESDEENQDEYL